MIVSGVRPAQRTFSGRRVSVLAASQTQAGVEVGSGMAGPRGAAPTRASPGRETGIYPLNCLDRQIGSPSRLGTSPSVDSGHARHPPSLMLRRDTSAFAEASAYVRTSVFAKPAEAGKPANVLRAGKASADTTARQESQGEASTPFRLRAKLRRDTSAFAGTSSFAEASADRSADKLSPPLVVPRSAPRPEVSERDASERLNRTRFVPRALSTRRDEPRRGIGKIADLRLEISEAPPSPPREERMAGYRVHRDIATVVVALLRSAEKSPVASLCFIEAQLQRLAWLVILSGRAPGIGNR